VLQFSDLCKKVSVLRYKAIKYKITHFAISFAHLKYLVYNLRASTILSGRNRHKKLQIKLESRLWFSCRYTERGQMPVKFG